MKPHPKFRLDLDRYERYCTFLKLFEFLSRAATTPVPMPARRRRRDREIPKAA